MSVETGGTILMTKGQPEDAEATAEKVKDCFVLVFTVRGAGDTHGFLQQMDQRRRMKLE